MKNDTKIILIGGTGRCGTNVLKSIISLNESTYSLPFEHRFTVDPHGLVDFYNSYTSSWSPFLADKKIKDLERYLLGLNRENIFKKFISRLIKNTNLKNKITSPNYSGWELNKWFHNYHNHVENLVKELVDFSYPASWPGSKGLTINNKMYYASHKNKQEVGKKLGNFINGLIGDTLSNLGKEYFVEDNTWNMLFLKELYEILPNAKFIHITRDPRDVVASFLNQKWCPNALNKAIIYYKDLMNKIESNMNFADYSFVLEIKFEELVLKRELILESISNFSGIGIVDNMRSFDLSHNHIGRWKSDFNNNEKKLINVELKNYIERYGLNLD